MRPYPELQGNRDASGHRVRLGVPSNGGGKRNCEGMNVHETDNGNTLLTEVLEAVFPFLGERFHNLKSSD